MKKVIWRTHQFYGGNYNNHKHKVKQNNNKFESNKVKDNENKNNVVNGGDGLFGRKPDDIDTDSEPSVPIPDPEIDYILN